MISESVPADNDPTCGVGELNLLLDDFHGDEVMLLIETAVVEQQTVRLSGGKSKKKTWKYIQRDANLLRK